MERAEPTVSSETVPAVTCRFCGTAKPATAEHWPVEKGELQHDICRVCSRQRKRVYDKKYRAERVAARTQTLAVLAETPTPSPAKEGMPTLSGMASETVELQRVHKLQIARALQAGASELNKHAQGILERILLYAGDPKSLHHEWALKLIAERVIPRKLYEDLGAQAAGIKAGQNAPARPAVTIIVQPATAPAPVEPSIKIVEGVAERVDEAVLE